MKYRLKNNLILENIGPETSLEIQKQLTLINPRYRTLQKLGKWTGNTPQKLYYYEKMEKNTLVCPRGFADRAYRICQQYGEDIRLFDDRIVLSPCEIQFHGRLRTFQKKAVPFILKESHGVLSAGTGSGKTVIALHVIAARKQPALVLVHTIELLNQWVSRIKAFLNIKENAIGIIGDGKYRIGNEVSVGLYQTVRKKTDEISPFVGHLIVDECHKCPSKAFTEAVSGFGARFRLGLTATAYRRDGLGHLIYFTLGEQRYIIEKAPLITNGDLCRAQLIRRLTEFETLLDPSNDYSKVLSELTKDRVRNMMICSDVARETHPGIKILLTDRKEHALALKTILQKSFHINAEVLTGATPRKERDNIVESLNRGGVKVFIATGQLIGEGFDLPGLSTLFLTTPIKFRGRLIQYIGRIIRPADGKKMGKIYDYVDEKVGVLNASARARLETYMQEGIEEANMETGMKNGN